MSKTWTDGEVKTLIAVTIIACRKDAVERNDKLSSEDLAEMIYLDLCEQGLIDLTP